MLAAEEVVSNKSEILELWKKLDQVSLLKKIILNENQCYMLNNRDLQTVINKRNSKVRDLKLINEEKNNERKVNLIEYLKKKKSENDLNIIDNLLYKYLDEKLKEEISKEAGLYMI